MKILGNRILVSKIIEPKKEGFQTVDVQDSFIYKGKVEQGEYVWPSYEGGPDPKRIGPGDVIQFKKYSPDTEEIEFDGKKMKIIKVEDVLAIL